MTRKFNKKIIRYYNATNFFYKHFWYDERTLALHYGLWDSSTKNRSDALINTNKTMAEIAKIRRGDFILDAGCGVGGSSIWLAKKFGTKNIGIAINDVHVKEAKKFAEEFGVTDRTKFYKMDFTKTKFPKETFDVVWAIESICHATNKSLFVSEALRVLKKNGRLIVDDAWITKKSLTEDDRRMLRIFCEGYALPGLESKARFEYCLRRSKFKNIKFYDKTRNVLRSAKIIHDRCLIAMPLAKFLSRLGIISNIVVKNMLSGIMAYKIIKASIGSYGIFYAEKGS